MPWLDKEKERILFIHVPRCGGTSITKHHRVGEKALKGHWIIGKLAIRYYYYRYRLLETANFPLLTGENAYAALAFVTGWLMFFFVPGLPVPYVLWTTSLLTFFISTVFATAPIVMRYYVLRNSLMFFFGYLACTLGSDVNYLVGTNGKSFLFHITSLDAIKYGYITEDDVKEHSFSIVRNPYSRAVSLYEYNKRLYESFEHFLREWHEQCMVQCNRLGRTQEKYVFCHVVPMHMYTHDIAGKQMVNTIIKQEHLKRLMATNWKDSGVPDKIQRALTGIPHANSRARNMMWKDYFTQETMDLVLEMYEKDFEIFGYDFHIPGRPDLVPKIKERTKSIVEVKAIAGPATMEPIPTRIPDIAQPIKIPSQNLKIEYDIEIGAPTAGEDTFEESPLPNKFGRQTSMSLNEKKISNEVQTERELYRKKRAASAFILQID